MCSDLSSAEKTEEKRELRSKRYCSGHDIFAIAEKTISEE